MKTAVLLHIACQPNLYYITHIHACCFYLFFDWKNNKATQVKIFQHKEKILLPTALDIWNLNQQVGTIIWELFWWRKDIPRSIESSDCSWLICDCRVFISTCLSNVSLRFSLNEAWSGFLRLLTWFWKYEYELTFGKTHIFMPLEEYSFEFNYYKTTVCYVEIHWTKNPLLVIFLQTVSMIA